MLLRKERQKWLLNWDRDMVEGPGVGELEGQISVDINKIYCIHV